jgi:hypothetical protein
MYMTIVLATGPWVPFSFTLERPPEPDSDVFYGSLPIPDQTGVVGFGSTDLGTPLSKTLTIKNSGDDTLMIDLQSFQMPAGFSLITPPAATVPAQGETTFTVALNAVNHGVFSSQMSFSSNDPDESPYNFTLSGQVTNVRPEIEVKIGDPAANVQDGSGVDWGTTGVGTPLTRTFTIVNSGTATLNLDVNSLLLPSGFSLISPFAAQVAPFGGQTSFTVELEAELPGAYHGFINFESDDLDEEIFTIWASSIVNGEGWTGPDIDVTNVALVNDTGISNSDLATYDPRVAGTVVGSFNGGSVEVQFDHNGDGLIDGASVVQSSGGGFTYDPQVSMPSLSAFVGLLTLRYRPVPRNAGGQVVSLGEWSQLAIDKLAVPAAGNLRFADIGLKADTGSSATDKLTVDPRVYAVVSGDLEGGSARIEFDHNGDGTPEGSSWSRTTPPSSTMTRASQNRPMRSQSAPARWPTGSSSATLRAKTWPRGAGMRCSLRSKPRPPRPGQSPISTCSPTTELRRRTTSAAIRPSKAPWPEVVPAAIRWAFPWPSFSLTGRGTATRTVK